MRVWAAGLLALPALAGLGVLVSAPPAEIVLGQYATPLVGRRADQRHNARLGLERLDGKRIAPGEVFSFNKAVAPWSRDRGYLRAPVSFDGELIESWGGGVCQTSTTLYNAALLAGLEIVERHPHRFAATYVPPGRDAAVAAGAVDLRFRNDRPSSVMIRARLSGDKVIVQILGPGPRPHVRIEERAERVAMPSEFRFGAGSRLRVRNSGKPGFEVTTFRVMGSKREILSSDHYPTMHRVLEYRSAQ